LVSFSPSEFHCSRRAKSRGSFTERRDPIRTEQQPRTRLLPAALLLLAASAAAYIGPGAGFGIVTSFFVFLNALLVSLASLLFWPVILLVRMAKRLRRAHRPLARRVVVLGLDGLSPKVASEMMERGVMPNLQALRDRGTFRGLATTCPGISPVAWSSFQTGVNPGRHGIFDFLKPDRKRYLAVLSSVDTRRTTARKGIWPFRRSREVTSTRLLRRSQPFWNHLGRCGTRSTVLRVPITYPPERLDGHLLSGMCVPDLRGTQGSYTLLRPGEDPRAATGGVEVPLSPDGDGAWTGAVPGPDGDDGPLEAPLRLRSVSGGYRLTVSEETETLTPGMLGPWMRVEYRVGGSRVRGITRARVTETPEGPQVYLTALHVDPSSPAVPISHPVTYSRYLAGMQGPYATLGLAEDTWALSNGATTEEGFLEQAWSIFEERRRMFADALRRTRRGLVVCVFDTSDRIQHMFWGHGRGPGSPIEEMYRRMDELIGETAGEMGRKDLLIVMSDHGFTSFHTCVDFNRWLVEQGYMVLKDGVETVETGFHGVDWSRTRAYAMGLAGIMLNLRGREGQGVVEPGGEAHELAAEIRDRLLSLETADGEQVVMDAWTSPQAYNGPYMGEGPDVVIGTRSGYRAGWGCVTGGVGPRVIYPNRRHWNGDHCHARSQVPGTLASNWVLSKDEPSILDVAPTVLDVLGAPVPDYMEGSPMQVGAADGEAGGRDR
jgi:predicted AlkP superfamily phosphohydrolase/phosphomutase